MEDVWKVHKKFIMAVAGGGLVVVLWYFFVLSSIEAAADGKKKELEKEKGELRDLLARGRPETGALDRLESDVALRRQMLKEAAEELVFLPAPRFQPSSREGAKKDFDDLKISLFSELQQASVSKQVVPPPTFGFDAIPDEFPDPVAREMLFRLAIVHRVWETLLDNVRGDRTRIEMVDPLFDNPDLSGGTIVQEGMFLNRVSVVMKLTTEAGTLFRFMDALQKPGRYLAITDFDAVREDLSNDLLDVRLVVSSLMVDPSSPIDPADGEGERSNW